MSVHVFARIALLVLLVLLLPGCQAIAQIFEAGIWVGIVIAVIVIGLIAMLVGRGRRG